MCVCVLEYLVDFVFVLSVSALEFQPHVPIFAIFVVMCGRWFWQRSAPVRACGPWTRLLTTSPVPMRTRGVATTWTWAWTVRTSTLHCVLICGLPVACTPPQLRVGDFRMAVTVTDCGFDLVLRGVV